MNKPHSLDNPVDIGGVEYVPLCCAKDAVAAARTEEVLNRDSVWGDGYSQAMHDAFGDMSMEEFVAAAEQRGAIAGVQEMAKERPARTLPEFREHNAYIRGVKAARDAVVKVPVLLVDVRFNPDDASRYVGAVNVSDALAAIDALKGEQE